MENRILLYKDEKRIDEDRRHAWRFIKQYAQPLADVLRELGIKASKDDFLPLIGSNDSVQRALSRICQELIDKQTNIADFMKPVFEKEFFKSAEPVYELAEKAHHYITNESNVGIRFMRKFMTITEEWEISLDPQYSVEIEDKHTEYADSDDRKRIWEEANKLLDHINEFRDLLTELYDKNELENKPPSWYAAPKRKLLPIAHLDSHDNKILKITEGGDIEIEKWSITLIK